MYNEEIKKAFLLSIQDNSTKKMYKTIFKHVEHLEYSNEIDLYCIPEEDVIKEIFKTMNIGSLPSLRVLVTKVRKYRIWADENKLIPEIYRGLLYEKANVLNLYNELNRVKIFRNPKEILQLIQKTFVVKHNYIGGIITDQLLAAYIVLLYEGIPDKDIFLLKKSNVLLKKNNIVVIYNENIIIINPIFDTFIRNICTNKQFMSLSLKNYGLRVTDSRLLDNGAKLSDSELRRKIREWASYKINQNIKDKRKVKFEDIYVMGKIHKWLQDGNDKYDKHDIAIYCYGDKPTQGQRERVYTLLNNW